MVDWGRRPYTTKFRPFKDDDTEVDLVWYPVAVGAKSLKYPSKVQSLDWVTMPWVATGVGEVFGAVRSFNGKESLPYAIGLGPCGSETDFTEGGEFDPLAPPTVYGPDGLPTCCLPQVIGEGTLLWSGTGDVSVASYSHVYTLSQQGVQVDDRLAGGVIGQRWVTLPPAGQSELNAPGYLGRTDWRTTYFSLCEWFTGADWDGTGARVFTGEIGPCFPTATVTSFP